MSPSRPRIIEYQLPGAWTVLVGGSDADNDYLSTELAALDDWWFHADGVSGSHVVLRAKPKEKPGRDTMRQAAALAAFHSKARAAGTVRVYCTRARFVKKARGAKPGTVQVGKGRVLRVHPGTGVATKT